MPNGMYGGVGGRKTKVGQKTYFVFRPTRLDGYMNLIIGISSSFDNPCFDNPCIICGGVLRDFR